MSARLPPLGLYVHLPWCIRKCPYCDFNSFELKRSLPEDAYVAALLRDLESDLPLIEDRPCASVFIGGGTPSLFSGAAIHALLDGIRARTVLVPDVEISLEANPGAAEAERFAEYRHAGVNRLSIGVQSFRAEQLGALGRVHGVAEAIAAVEAAHTAGFDNINIDLMYGLPGDTPEQSVGDLEQALALRPAHLSWYQLTLEPHTHFERHPPEVPDDDETAIAEVEGRRLLAARGFERYEVSAYARPGFRCRHNLNYWQFGDYLGIGAGAHGKLTVAAGRAIERRARTRNPKTYLAAAGTAAATTVDRIESSDALLTEFLMNALRLVDGVSLELVSERAGQSVERMAKWLDAARQRGWLSAEPGRLVTTATGMQSLNRLLTLL